MAVSGNLVLGQQAIYALGDEIRGRLNGLFMAIFFAGGAFGSAVGGWTYAQGGWTLASAAGLCLPVLAFLYYLTELPRKSGIAGKAASGEI
ncbi:Major Facilitator Superfamily protein [compost metagenome]